MPDAPLPPDRLRTRLTRDGDLATLVLQGEFDMAGVPEVTDRLTEAEDSGAGTVVIDMAGVEFIDSTAMRVLLDAHRRAAEGGYRLVIRELRGNPRRMIELTGLHLTLNLEGGAAG